MANISEGSLQVTVVGVLPHVTAQRRHIVASNASRQ